MKLWVVKDEKGKIQGSSIKGRDFAWFPVYRKMPVNVMAKALEAVGWAVEEYNIPELTETEEEENGE